MVSQVVARSAGKALRRQAVRAPRNAAATSFKRYARTVGALGRDALQVSVPGGFRVRRVSASLLRGPAPASPQAFLRLSRRHRIKTIVTLLDPTNPKERGLIALERAMAKKLGLRLRRVSMPFGVEPPAGSVRKFLRIVRDPRSGRIYLHCRLGRDRTGTMVALYRMAVEGRTGRSALAEMKRFGYNPRREPYLGYLGAFVRKVGNALGATSDKVGAALGATSDKVGRLLATALGVVPGR